MFGLFLGAVCASLAAVAVFLYVHSGGWSSLVSAIVLGLCAVVNVVFGITNINVRRKPRA